MSEMKEVTEAKTLVRFVIVGVCSAGFFFITCALLLHAGFETPIAGATAYVVAFHFSYLLQHGWSFTGATPHARALPRYLTVQVTSLGIVMSVLYVTTDCFHASPILASVIATVTNGSFVFAASRWWVFQNA